MFSDNVNNTHTVMDELRQWLAEKALENEVVDDERWHAELQSRGYQDVMNLQSDPHLTALEEKRRAEARAQAQQESVIDLDTVRNLGLTLEFVLGLPDATNLHLHSLGAIDAAFIAERLAATDAQVRKADLLGAFHRRGVFIEPEALLFLHDFPDTVAYRSLTASDKSALASLFVLPEGTHSFSRFEAAFSATNWLIDAVDLDQKDSWRRILETQAKLGVRHVEFTEPLSCDDETIQDIISTKAFAKDHLAMTVGFNYAFFRFLDAEDALEEAQSVFADPLSKHFAGIDFIGPEEAVPGHAAARAIYGLRESLAKRGKTHLRGTMHAGEFGNPLNPRMAMLVGAERLGHAVTLENDIVGIRYAQSRGIGVEACIQSNVRLGAAQSVKSHPFLSLLRSGLQVSLCTDNDGIFATNLQTEFTRVIEETNVTYAELKKLVVGGVQTAFLSNEERAVLLGDIHKRFRSFEEEWVKRAPSKK